MHRLTSLLLASAVAAAGLGASAALAQPYAPPGPPPVFAHPWHHGDHYRGPWNPVNHWWHYRLPRPPHGYVWIKNGPRFLLVGPHGYVDRVWG